MFKFKSKLLSLLVCIFAFSSVNCAKTRPDGLVAAFKYGVLYQIDNNNPCPTINSFASRQFAYLANGFTFLPLEILFSSSIIAFCLLALVAYISQLSIECFCEAWSRYKKTMPEKQTPGFFGFCKDVFKRSICKGKDGRFNRKTSPPKILAQILLYCFLVGNISRNNESIFAFVRPDNEF